MRLLAEVIFSIGSINMDQRMGRILYANFTHK